MDKQKARIKNWKIKTAGGYYWLEGNVFGHPNHEHVTEGHLAHTSQLVSINFELGVAETLNTIYTLE